MLHKQGHQWLIIFQITVNKPSYRLTWRKPADRPAATGYRATPINWFSDVAESQKRDDEAMDTDDGDGRNDKSSIQSSVESIKVWLIIMTHAF